MASDSVTPYRESGTILSPTHGGLEAEEGKVGSSGHPMHLDTHRRTYFFYMYALLWASCGDPAKHFPQQGLLSSFLGAVFKATMPFGLSAQVFHQRRGMMYCKAMLYQLQIFAIWIVFRTQFIARCSSLSHHDYIRYVTAQDSPSRKYKDYIFRGVRNCG